jgi:hypothetical protein
VITLVLACSDGWTTGAALAPSLARVDRDGDGAVTGDEYDAVRYAGPPFPQADLDGNGRLDLPELEALLRGQDALTFDAGRQRRALTPADPAAMPGAMSAESRALWELLGVLAAEVPEPPTPAEILAASATGRLDSPESVAMLDRLRAGWAARGMAFPEL